MIAQLRLYTVKPGQLDAFVSLFRESLAPIHEQYGIRILGAWVNREANEFIWLRAFPDEASIEPMTRRDRRPAAVDAREARGALGRTRLGAREPVGPARGVGRSPQRAGYHATSARSGPVNLPHALGLSPPPPRGRGSVSGAAGVRGCRPLEQCGTHARAAGEEQPP